VPKIRVLSCGLITLNWLCFFCVDTPSICSQATRLCRNAPAGQCTNNAWQTTYAVPVDRFSCCRDRYSVLDIWSIRCESPLNQAVSDYCCPVSCRRRWTVVVLSVFSIQRVRLHGCVHPTCARITNIITSRSSRRTIHSFWLLAAGFDVIGLIASALQIQRAKRVIAYDAVPFSGPFHRVFSAAQRRLWITTPIRRTVQLYDITQLYMNIYDVKMNE